MILIDTGVIISLLNTRDADHAASVGALKRVREPLISTWPCLTEAMYLLERRAGKTAQEALMTQVEAGLLQFAMPGFDDTLRAFTLMRKYADVPMDFADASLVVAAEVLGITRILTLDQHFYAYRIHDTLPFEVSP